MPCLIPRSDKFTSPKSKTKTGLGWKHLMRAVRSKLRLGLVRGSSNLRLNSQNCSSTRPFFHHHHYYHQYNRYPYQEHLSTRKSLSLSRTEGASRDKKTLVLASPTLLMPRSQDEMEGSQSRFATANTNDQDDVLHEDLHDHHVLEDGLHLDEEALGLDDVYKKITNTTTTIVTTTPTTLERNRLCGVDVEADKFIEDFRKTLALERKKSAEKFWATLSTKALESRPCGVDAQADQFIEEFRRRMRLEELERQKSAEDFWRMLARWPSP